MGFGELPYSVTPELLQLLAPVKSIAQRSRRSQRGILEGDGASGLWVDVVLLGGKHPHREEHRTEVIIALYSLPENRELSLSLTSRCNCRAASLRFECFPPTSQAVHQNIPKIPLCGLRDLWAI
jgi:hypothetical protein